MAPNWITYGIVYRLLMGPKRWADVQALLTQVNTYIFMYMCVCACVRGCMGGVIAVSMYIYSMCVYGRCSARCVRGWVLLLLFSCIYNMYTQAHQSN